MLNKTITCVFIVLLSIMSVSAKDIPYFQELVACTPAKANTIYYDEYWCYSDLEYTVVLRIQNWTEEKWKNVTVKIEIPLFMEYVPNSTEYASKFEMINGHLTAAEWQTVNDDDTEIFPLLKGAKIVDTIQPCSTDDNNCSKEIVFVRFRTKVKDTTPKNEVFELTATISAERYPSFWANMGYPVKLVYSDSGCVEKQEDVDLSECGGTPETTDEQPETDSDPVTDNNSETSEKDNSSGCNVLII